MTRYAATESDEELYWRWAKSRSAEDQLVLSRALWRYARSIVWAMRGYEDRELITDIVTKAFERESQFRGDSKFTTWFYRLAYNTTLHAIGKEHRRREWSLESFPEMGATMEPELAIYLEQLSKLLQPRDQMILRGKLVGSTDEELAAELGLELEGLRSRWKRLKRLLRRHLSEGA